MPKKNHTILAIDPGTRKMGYAILSGTELLEHGVKVFAHRHSAEANLREGRQTILRFIKMFNPSVLAVERVFFGKTTRTALLTVLYQEILRLGRRKGLTVVSYAPTTVKKFATGDGKADKAQVAQRVVKDFPELRAYIVEDKQWKMLHHSNMFDAVAVAMLARDEG